MEMDPPKRTYMKPLYKEILEVALKENGGDAQAIRLLRIYAGEAKSPRYEWWRWRTRMRRSIAKRLGFVQPKPGG